jgi:hypothetical protein
MHWSILAALRRLPFAEVGGRIWEPADGGQIGAGRSGTTGGVLLTVDQISVRYLNVPSKFRPSSQSHPKFNLIPHMLLLSQNC